MIVHPAVEMGRERVPLLIVDDAHPAVEDLHDAARAATFGRSAADHYPGIRAAAPPGYAQWLETLAAQAGLGARPVVVRTSFAIATDSPAELAPIQRIPHFDTPDPTVTAAVHYLCAAPHGGTGFYRHKRTGFERVDASRQPAWRQSLACDAREGGMPDTPCGRESSPLFDLIGLADLQFNRVIFYPANCLHSGIVGVDALSASPMLGRLTMTSLLGADLSLR